MCFLRAWSSKWEITREIENQVGSACTAAHVAELNPHTKTMTVLFRKYGLCWITPVSLENMRFSLMNLGYDLEILQFDNKCKTQFTQCG